MLCYIRKKVCIFNAAALVSGWMYRKKLRCDKSEKKYDRESSQVKVKSGDKTSPIVTEYLYSKEIK